MGYDYSYSIENVQSFLIRLLNIDVGKLIADAVEKKLKERGLSVVSIEDDNNIPPYPEGQRLILSNGTVYVHKLTERSGGCNWGTEKYLFIDEKEPVLPEITYTDY